MPLEGIRVIEAGVLLAGPYCGQVLGDFGAEVIKIESPGVGDPMRQWGQAQANGQQVWWPIIGRNKKSVELDLRGEAGQQAFRDLAASADIVLENFRPGTLERWGAGYDVLSELNPGIILVRVSGFGQTGPYAQRAGYASVAEAIGGLRQLVGYPDRPSCRVGISLGDTLTGILAALGAVMALQQRHRTQRGQVVDAAIYESVFSVMESILPEYVFGGRMRERTGPVLPNIAPSNAYPTKDGRELVIAANQDSVFVRFCEAMERPDLARDDRFSTHYARGQNQELLDSIIAEWSSTHTMHELSDLLVAHAVPVGPIYRAPDMLDDPHFRARNAIITVDDHHFGEFEMQGVFPQLSESPGGVRWTGPPLGAHNKEILTDLLGMDEQAAREAQYPTAR
jgi:crotonobetainyl-CoA:carnitine CoA-transferase CaiB-like acyl-CoA transferase